MFRNLFLLAAISLLTAAATNAGVEVTENHLTGEKKITLNILSETKVSNSIGSMESASIVLRCEGKELDGYVWTPTYNGISRHDKATLKIKFYGGIHNVPGLTGKTSKTAPVQAQVVMRSFCPSQKISSRVLCFTRPS